MMVKCWASCLGGCSVDQSAEHYFTKGLFKGKNVIVGGFNWLKGEHKEIGLASLTVKNLCRQHNSDLSEVDMGAIDLFKTIEELIRVHNVRKKFKTKGISHFKKYQADGKMFERWAAKFLIGLLEASGENDKWHLTGAPKENPPVEVVQAVFGLQPFVSPMGLYAALVIGEKAEYMDGVGAEFYMHPQGLGVSGAAIYFQGFRFMIWLHNEEPNTYSFELDDGRTMGLGGEPPIYHPVQFNFKLNRQWSSGLKFIWD